MTIYLSASMIKDYLVCKKRGYYRGKFSEEAIPSPEMAVGTLVHSVLETEWKDKSSAFEKAAELIKLGNINGDVKLVYKCLDNFFSMFPEGYFSSKDRIERFFRVSYEKDVQLIGKMDRIHDNIVFDWKTGSPPTDINTDAQFVCYYLAYRKMFSRYPSNLIYVHLPMGKLHYFRPVPEIIEEFQKNIIPAVIKGLREEDYSRTGLFTYGACKKCSFRKICYEDLNYNG